MTKILTAHQPAYIPWLGLFHKIALADVFVSFNQVQYLPKDWNSRNKIKTPQGDMWMTVPVLKSGHRDKKLAEIEINNSTRWAEKHWKSLLVNYARSPYFPRYAAYFEEVYLRREWTLLADLCEEMLLWFLDELGLHVEYLDARDLDLRGAKSELVLDMCRKIDCQVYVFGKLGRDYADVEAFRAAGVEPCFQDYRHPVYRQQHGAFLPYMSVVDLLFNHGPSSLEIIMDGNLTKADVRRLAGGTGQCGM
ncbi:WbqC family protein [Desulfocurvus sp.]|uniref:WbqC family protein n=1 Tax=Desulfocurvus sp. TaxID=2871698 RepID=UPI0025C34FED|nr:WbqC family protein [Desulfocurvus sp.]MCK9241333.1 WbqC family protein [Desulfocurvus sp.]